MHDGDALVRYLHGEITLEAFASAIRSKVIFEFRGDARAIRVRKPLAARLRVAPSDLRPFLLRYVVGTVTAEMISMWAWVLVTLTAFERPGGSPAAETLWECMRELSQLPIAENVTPRRVARILAKLPSIERELAREA